MAIDGRQIADINFSMPNFGLELIIEGEDPDYEVIDMDNVQTVRFKVPRRYFIQEVEQLSASSIAPLDNPQPLNFYSPETIVQQVRAGRAREYWNIGDRISIMIGAFSMYNNPPSGFGVFSQQLYEAVVIGFDHNLEKETPDYEHTMTFMIIDNPERTNFSYYNKTEYVHMFMAHDTYMSKVIDNFYPAFYNVLPDEWRNVIINTKKTGVHNAESAQCKIFSLSYYEMHGSSYYNNDIAEYEYKDGAQQQYEYFKSQPFGVPKKFYSGVYRLDSEVLSEGIIKDGSETTRYPKIGGTITTYGKYIYPVASRTKYHNLNNTMLWLNASPDILEYYIASVSSELGYLRSNLIKSYKYPFAVTDGNASDKYSLFGVTKAEAAALGNVTAGFIPCFTIG